MAGRGLTALCDIMSWLSIRFGNQLKKIGLFPNNLEFTDRMETKNCRVTLMKNLAPGFVIDSNRALIMTDFVANLYLSFTLRVWTTTTLICASVTGVQGKTKTKTVSLWLSLTTVSQPSLVGSTSLGNHTQIVHATFDVQSRRILQNVVIIFGIVVTSRIHFFCWLVWSIILHSHNNSFPDQCFNYQQTN